MNQILYSKSMPKAKVMMIILLILILLILSFFGLGFLNRNSNKILKGVSIDAVNVGNMTIEEANQAMMQQQESLDSKKYLLTYGNREVSVSGEEIELKYNGNLVEEAYAYGRSGNIFEDSVVAWKSLFNTDYTINAGFSANSSIIGDKVAILMEEEKSTVLDDKYEISGDKIFIYKGHDGVTADDASVMQTIIENAGTADSEIKVNVKVDLQEAKRIDFDKVYEEIYVEKANASYTQEDDGDVKYVEETIGITFDRNTVETEYLNLENGATMEITLVRELPEITTKNLEDVLFGDILATYKTTYNASNKDRSTNLEVAARNINETILLPGEEFSYNKEVGKRTYANGFKDAHIFSGGKVVDGLGGGICQISSTLYNAVLMADLEVTERKNHMMYPEYVKPSLDATVVWGSIDFKSKNNRETPIKIVATVKNGVATTTIYGKKVEGEPIVQIESVIEKTEPYTTVTEYDNTLEEGKIIVTQDPVNGYVSKAYKILKDAEGNEISKTLISSDTYKQTSKIVKVGTKKVEQPVEPDIPAVPDENENTETPNVNQENTSDNVENNNNNSNVDHNDGWPTGWDTPENPFYN